MKKSLKFIIYPPLCSHCNKALEINREYDNSYLCPTCFKLGRMYLDLEKDLEFVGGYLVSDDFKYLKTCVAVLEYNEFYKVLLNNYKFGYNKDVAKSFIKIIEPFLEKNINYFEQFDLITCAPLHYLREKYRGFNQSDLLAEQISLIVNKPYYNDILLKTINTPPQTTVDKHMRKTNVANAFTVNSKYDIRHKKILIIDDIFITGYTIMECAKTLLDKGCEEVCGLTLLKSSKNVQKD